MPINITAAGAAGTHSLARVSVNSEENYVYFRDTNIPLSIVNGTSYIYANGVGSITGITSGDLVYADIIGTAVLKFKNISNAEVDITESIAGGVSFNTPIVYSNILQIGASSASNQAVKYYTAGTPLTGLTSGNTYFLKNVTASFAGTQALYTLAGDAHTFTTAGISGQVGPTIAQLRASYTGAGAWSGTYLNQGTYLGYQDWTVPISGIYQFDVSGASGFNGSGAGGVGRGATVRGRVSLTKGEVITIAVGQVGEAPTSLGVQGGSGGGTFVVRKTGTEPLFAAGGGSAESNSGAGRDAVLNQLGGTSTNGTAANATVAGLGGRAAGGASAAGGGFTSRGQDSTVGERGGGSFLDGLLAVDNGSRIGGNGGFGGGASSDGTTFNQSGGGGGYSGGGGARTTIANQSGGGGGSYIIPTATNVGTSTGLYDGLSILSGSVITNLASYNTGEGSVAMSLISSFTTGNEVYPTAADSEAGTNKIAIAPAGSSYHAFVPINYDLDNDLIHSATAHGLIDGEAIVPTFNTLAPAGLSNGSIYYVNRVNNFTYRLQALTLPSTLSTINLTTPSGRSTSVSDRISRVVVNTVTDTLTITAHGFLVDQPIQYDNGSGNPAGVNTGSIAPLQHLTTYYVADVLNANQIKLKVALKAPTPIDFTSAGTGTAHSFIFITVNALEDSLYIPNHGLVSGQAVRYSNGGGTTIPGLTNNATYYIVVSDPSIVRLALNANLNTFANITGVGTGTQSLLITSLDYATDTISVPAHGFLQKELVLYDAKGQTVINGLTTATPYYVIFVNGDQIKLATTPENADIGSAVNITDTPAGVGVHSLQSLSKTPDGIYVVDAVPTPTTFTVAAAGKVPTIAKSFNPRASVDLNLSAFKIPSHGFLTGTKVTYNKGTAATVIGGLTDLTDYYVLVVNRDYLKLATTAQNAAAGTTLTTTDFGTGVAHLFTTNQINGNITGGGSVTVVSGSVLVNGVGTSFSKILKVGDRFRLFPPNTLLANNIISTDINTTNNQITEPTHGYTTGDTVVFSANGGVSPSPLVDGYYYFVRAVDLNTITLHSSAADATSNNNTVDISTTGTVGAAGNFTFTRTTPRGPIVRRITAIGSDTQISVDRPYASAFSAVSYSYPTFVYVRPEGYSLHRPFDGGVEMSAGSRTSLGSIVRQTRKYFRYQSGKGLQTSCGINFKPSIDVESMSRFSSTTIEVKTRRPHGLISGLSIRLSQATDSYGNISQIYNGDFQVTVVDLTTFRVPANGVIAEDIAYGFPQFYVISWANGAVRTGMFDYQNGMFYEFDGQKIYAVRRSSTQQLAGTVSALQGNEVIFGTNTRFQAQVDIGDYIVLRGQSYRIVEIGSDTRMSVRPEYKGASGTEKEFNPATVVNTTTDVFLIIGHGFSDLLPVTYNSIDGETIGGLINGRTYYVNLIDNNSFKIKASPVAVDFVNLSSVGTTTVHSFTPAKSGIIVTKTVDTKIPQEDWSIDPCDGTGVTGYNLDLSRIQMAYMDYSWYGAGKIRFGFKTTDGQVQYVHEFIHNNNLYESYFRSGNLPARYEVATYENPTYIPFLFHWGTSVIMDGRFDDDNAYLFTGSSQTLNIPGTTAKSFASTGINLTTDLFTVQSHGFNTGDILEFHSTGANGLAGANSLNPATAVVGLNTLENLTNSTRYKAFVNSANLIHLTPLTATITSGATFSRTASTVTVVTAAPHGITSASNYVGVYGISTAGAAITNLPTQYVGAVTVTNSTTFTFTVAGSFSVTSTSVPSAVISEVINFTSQGNTQYTYFLYPDGSFNNTSGPNYQPLISIRLSPSVSSGLTGKLGDRDVINRMQLRLQEIGVSSTQLVDVKLLLNSRLNNLNFQGVDVPSLTQIVEHTAADTVSGGIQVYNFKASGGTGGGEATTTVSVSSLFELSNSILGGDSIFPDGPDILTIAVSRLTGASTLTSAKISWAEAQA
jgi:hypothetical protein